MEFALAILVYTLTAVVLGAGILLLLAGKPWLLVLALLAYPPRSAGIGWMTH